MNEFTHVAAGWTLLIHGIQLLHVLLHCEMPSYVSTWDKIHLSCLGKLWH